MYNWFTNKRESKSKMINAIMSELETLTKKESNNTTANYWIDGTHNVLAFINDNGDDDKWIEIHYELYDSNKEIVGDLAVGETDEVDKYELLEEIVAIVELYYGD